MMIKNGFDCQQDQEGWLSVLRTGSEEDPVGTTVHTRGIKRLRSEADHSSPTNAKVFNCLRDIVLCSAKTQTLQLSTKFLIFEFPTVLSWSRDRARSMDIINKFAPI